MRDGITLYLIRHGETDWNAERRYQGQTDINLNDKGRTQARRNGRALASLGQSLSSALDFVSSPLGRARETMEIVRAELGLDPADYRIDERLIELSYGSWEGKLQSELPVLDPGGLAERAKDPYRWRPDGGESYEDLFKRVARWAPGLKVSTVAVAHGGVSRCLRALLGGSDPEDIPTMEAPQDRVLVLRGGTIEWI